MHQPFVSYSTALVTVILAFNNAAQSLGIFATECSDWYGVRTSPYTWLDWIFTVPYMIFLVTNMDFNRNMNLAHSETISLILSFLSIYLLFIMNIPYIPSLTVIRLVMTSANILMTISLYLLYSRARDEYSSARSEFLFQSKMNDELLDIKFRTAYERLKIAHCRLSCSSLIVFFFTLYPIIYYYRLFNFIDDWTLTVQILILNCVVKGLFLQFVSDCVIELMDPNQFLLVLQKQMSEQQRIAFLRYIFHEIRVPLNSLSLAIEYILGSDNLSASLKESLIIMQNSATFMADTLNDVLDFQKIEEGKLSLEFKSFNLSNMIKNASNIHKSSSTAKGITLQYVIESDVPSYVIGDSNRLIHVLSNLISNAIKFSSDNSCINILVTFESKLPGHVTFMVRDQGIGIRIEDQSTLFKPFAQIRAGELQKGRGSGLGLTICKSIVVLHGGVMGFSSKVREGEDISTGGSEFFFSIKFNLPAKSEENLDSMAKDDKSPPSSPAGKNEGKVSQPVQQTLHTLCCDGNIRYIFIHILLFIPLSLSYMYNYFIHIVLY